MEQFEKQLKSLKSIQPDKDYAKKSRMLILASHQKTPAFVLNFKNVIEIVRSSTAVGLALFIIITLWSGVFYVNKTYSPLALEGLNQASLVTEAEEINNSIEVTLGQINYLDQTNQKTLKAIDTVSENKPIINAIVSSESTTTIATSSATIEDVDSYLIEKPTAAEEANQKINDLLDEISQ